MKAGEGRFEGNPLPAYPSIMSSFRPPYPPLSISFDLPPLSFHCFICLTNKRGAISVAVSAISNSFPALPLFLFFCVFLEDSWGHKKKEQDRQNLKKKKKKQGLGAQLLIHTDKANGRSGRQAESSVDVCASIASIEASYRNVVSLNPFAG